MQTTSNLQPTHLSEADKAFEKALKIGILSRTPGSYNYVNNYMFMGFYKGKDQFKNIYTRKYLVY